MTDANAAARMCPAGHTPDYEGRSVLFDAACAPDSAQTNPIAVATAKPADLRPAASAISSPSTDLHRLS
ncbi:hypothetical protein SCB29_40475, partial [Paraburkholderia sp. SIMBA_055]